VLRGSVDSAGLGPVPQQDFCKSLRLLTIISFPHTVLELLQETLIKPLKGRGSSI
jgi:hypothetical protein